MPGEQAVSGMGRPMDKGRKDIVHAGTWTPLPSLCCCHSLEAHEHVRITHRCSNIWFVAEPGWHSRLMHLSFISGVTDGKNLTVPGHSYVDFHLLQTSIFTFFTQSSFHVQKSWQCHRPGFSRNENCSRGKLEKTDINQKLGCISRATWKGYDENGWKYPSSGEEELRRALWRPGTSTSCHSEWQR